MNRMPNPGVTPDFRNEQNAFALACFRAIGSESAGARPWEAVRDWPRAVQILEIHGLLPCLDRAAEAPDDVRRLVLETKLRAATYQSNALDALNEISREMGAAGIPHAVLKGTYLYELLYRELFPRAYGDVDLLVPANRIAEAMAALERAGYDGDSKPGAHGPMPRWHFHAALTSRKPGGLPVELHRSLVDRANLYRIREEELFGRLVEFRVRQGGFTVLSAEDQLLYLCLHVAKHGILNSVGLRNGFAPEWFCDPAAGNRLLWFLDIELFLRKHNGRLDWPAVAERMRRWNVSEDVGDCLRVLRLLRPGSAAEVALERLGDCSPAGISRPGMVARLLRSETGQAWLERSMRTAPRLCFRPIRCFLLGRSLAPSPARILGYYRKTNPAWLPWLYFKHPVHMVRKMLGPG